MFESIKKVKYAFLPKPGHLPLVLMCLLGLPAPAPAQDEVGNPAPLDHSKLMQSVAAGTVSQQEAIRQLFVWYRQDAPPAVRRDLMALLLRAQRHADILQLCSSCRLESYGGDELEILAKAARETGQWLLARQYYQRLQIVFPKKTIGWDGEMLTAIEAGQFEDAQRLLAQYRQKNGADRAYQQAQNYLAEQFLSKTEQLAYFQAQLEAEPHNRERVLQLYRVAARLGAQPVNSIIKLSHSCGLKLSHSHDRFLIR